MNEGAEGQTDSQWGDQYPDVSSECLSLTARKGWLLGTRNRSFRQRALHLLLQGWFSAPVLCCPVPGQIPTPIPAPLTPSGPGRHLNGCLPLRTVPLPQTSPAQRNTPDPTLASVGLAGCRQVHSSLWFVGRGGWLRGIQKEEVGPSAISKPPGRVVLRGSQPSVLESGLPQPSSDFPKPRSKFG